MRYKQTISAIVATFALAGTAPAKDLETKTITAKTVSTVVFENGAGDLAIATHEGDDVVINAEKLDFNDEHCTYAITQTGSEVLVKVERHVEGFFSSDCDVDIKISVPTSTKYDYDLRIGAGNLTLDGITGNLDFKLGAGNLDAKNVSLGELDGKSGAGNIDLMGTVANGEIKLGTGNALVKLTAISEGGLEINTGTGNAEIKVPSEAKIATEAKSGLGNVINQASNQSDAKYKISVKAGIGNASISLF